MSVIANEQDYEWCPGTLERVTEEREWGYGRKPGKGLCADCGYEVPLWFAHRGAKRLKRHYRKKKQ